MNKFYKMDCEEALVQIDADTVQMIYIDPPYNTKNNMFEYIDDFENWDEFIQTKLEKSKRILKDTGFIFISIDDNKLANLILLCNEIFGEKNKVGIFITRQATKSNSKFINTIHEYVVCYCKDIKKAPNLEIERINIPGVGSVIKKLQENVFNIINEDSIIEAKKYLKSEIKKIANDNGYSWIKNYNIVDENGYICFAKDLSVPGEPNELKLDYNNKILPKLGTRKWQSKSKIEKLYKEKKIIEKNGRPYEKHLLIESKDKVMSILNFYSRQGTRDLEKLGLGKIFSTAKPVELIKYLIRISCKKDDIVLDYFAGSGTTAQAVVEVNNEDKKNIEFVICQNKEPVKNNKQAVKVLKEEKLPVTIDSITKLRLKKLKELYKINVEEVE